MFRIAIDFGSGVTKIYMSGCGVVLSEATCVAVEEDYSGAQKVYTVKVYGDKARALFGKATQNTHIVNPISEGEIVYEDLAASLLKYFLEKIEITPKAARKTEAIFILPCGAKQSLINKYKRLAEACEFSCASITFVPFASILGHGVSIKESNAMFSIDIGYGITNIAAVSQNGIISGISLNLGGGNIDAHIIDELAENYDFKIGSLTAEKIKNTLGSIREDDNKSMVAEGRRISGGAPASMAVNSSYIYKIITTYIDKILEYVNLLMAKLPAEVSSGIMGGGIYLSGGLFKMDGLAHYIEEKLDVHVHLPEEPQYAAVIGAGTILSNDKLFYSLANVL